MVTSVVPAVVAAAGAAAVGALRRALANKARAGAEAKAAKGKGAGQEAEAPPAEALRGGEDAARAVGLSAPKGAAAAAAGEKEEHERCKETEAEAVSATASGALADNFVSRSGRPPPQANGDAPRRRKQRRASIADHLPSLEKRLDALALVVVSQDDEAGKLRIIFRMLREAASQLVSADRASLFLVEKDAGSLWTVLDNGKNIEMPLTAGLAGACATAGAVVNVPDAYADARFNQEVDRKFGYRTLSVLCLPVMVGKDCIGVLQCVNKTVASVQGPFTQTDAELLGGFLSIVAVAISTVRAMGAEKNRKARFDSLRDMAVSLLVTVEAQPMLSLLQRNARTMLGCEAACVMLADEISQELVSFMGGKEVRLPLNTPCVATMVMSQAEDVLRKVHRHGGATQGSLNSYALINDPSKLEGLSEFDSHGVLDSPQAMLCMALVQAPRVTVTGMVTGRVVGVVQCYNKGRANERLSIDTRRSEGSGSDPSTPRAGGGAGAQVYERFNEEDVDVLKSFCQLAAQGVANSNNYTSVSTTRHLDIMGADADANPTCGRVSPDRVLARVRGEAARGGTPISSANDSFTGQSPFARPKGADGGGGADSGTHAAFDSPRELSPAGSDTSGLSAGSRMRAMSLRTDNNANHVSMDDIKVYPAALGDRQDLLLWSFDILKEARKELPAIVVRFFDAFNICDAFDIPRATLNAFVNRVLDSYNDNPYHNVFHAVQVTHTVFLLLVNCERVKQYLSLLDVFAVLVAAICHDMDHRGTNNAFHMQLMDDLALAYNDLSVMEQHHCRLAFKVLREPGCNILENLSNLERQMVRKLIISCIMGTDMSLHHKHLAQLKNHLEHEFNRESMDDRQLLLSSILHVADLSNPTLPFELAAGWEQRVSREFKDQTIKEEEMNLPVSTHMAKTDPLSRAGGQVSFITMFVQPLWETMSLILPELRPRYHELLKNLKYYAKTQERLKVETRPRSTAEEGGLTNLADLAADESSESDTSSRAGANAASITQAIHRDVRSMSIVTHSMDTVQRAMLKALANVAEFDRGEGYVDNDD